MAIPMKEPVLMDAPDETALEVSSGGAVAMFERLARDPAVDVEKLERLIGMQERILRHQAKAAFDTAFAEMQHEIPEITERGEIKVEGTVRSRYATNEDIQKALKPILGRHGFSLRFRHEQDGGKLKVIGILSHRSGHSEQDEFVTAPDSGGKMNDIQRIGSARSYGQRYTTLALLNIATRGADDDGRKAGKVDAPAAPAGYDEWAIDMASKANEGWPALSTAWKNSKKDYRDYATQHDNDKWKALRAKAEKVQA